MKMMEWMKMMKMQKTSTMDEVCIHARIFFITIIFINPIIFICVPSSLLRPDQLQYFYQKTQRHEARVYAASCRCIFDCILNTLI
ncbi:MAG: hypothetical protein EAZ92_00435 [Candidatus Kapaibacterium sp.]|nr:MAG: hypothetical protein EAZ92_00435 [Candidatus Kapabacteria bacterium]